VGTNRTRAEARQARVETKRANVRVDFECRNVDEIELVSPVSSRLARFESADTRRCLLLRFGLGMAELCARVQATTTVGDNESLIASGLSVDVRRARPEVPDIK
jgi:hypothetical protein